MRLSVIIPAYNCAGLIPATLESLKAQTLKDFEVLILNDGSTDSTLSVLKAYARTDPRFQIFHLPNGGLPAHATGESSWPAGTISILWTQTT